VGTSASAHYGTLAITESRNRVQVDFVSTLLGAELLDPQLRDSRADRFMRGIRNRFLAFT